MAYKRILTVQDISCVGQCSMTVALPILSACGHETCILPTAVLSTHTGGFGKPAAVSLGDILESVTAHWKAADIRFDGIYTGYLGSIQAIRCVERIVDELLAPGGIFVADPAMADHGKRYSGLDADYAKAMEQLCRRADILLPNITEAAMFAGLPYREQPDEAYIRSLLAGLDQEQALAVASPTPTLTPTETPTPTPVVSEAPAEPEFMRLVRAPEVIAPEPERRPPVIRPLEIVSVALERALVELIGQEPLPE